MSNTKGTRILVIVFLGLLMTTLPGESRRLPQPLCDIYKGLFQFYGCVNHRTHICNILYNLLTRVEFGRPACNYYACNGYGRHVGQCRSAIFCLFSIERNGICNRGDVCCRNLLRADGGNGFADNSTLLDTTPAMDV